jgi:iron(III) transport system substrate-binding protein
MMMRWISLRLGFLFLALNATLPVQAASSASLQEEMVAKAKKEGEVVFMGDVATELKTLLKGFLRKYPFIQLKGIEARSGDTINRVAAETKAGRLSVDVSGMSLDKVIPLQQQNLLSQFDSPHLRDFPSWSQPSNKLYVVGQSNPLPQAVYNTNLVPAAEVPKSWDEMLDPKWKGKTIVSRSRSDIPAQMAWLFRKGDQANWDRSFEIFKGIKRLDPVLGGAGINAHVARVAAGEFSLFWFPASGSVLRLQLKGAPVRLIALPKMFTDYRVWMIFKDAPHPASAWLLVDYFLSPEGQFELSDTVDGILPLNSKAKPGKLARMLMDQGFVTENLDLVGPEKLLQVFSEDFTNKSETFYFNLMGYK